MKKNILWIVVLVASIALLGSCQTTTYQKMGKDGGYDDFPLGAGKYQIVAKGNAFTSPQRVRAIAFLRAAELTTTLGKKGFYILDDKGKTTHEVSSASDTSGVSSFDTWKHEFQIVIEPTDNEDGIPVQETYDRYKEQLSQ